jgi:hypothetical protein
MFSIRLPKASEARWLSSAEGGLSRPSQNKEK